MPILRLTRGTVFAQDYEILGPLAEGGMGSVYVARQLSTGKERALKVMQPSLASDTRTRARFTREARAGSQIDSEHVVEVVGAGVDPETSIPWLAMELLRGEDLASYADRVGALSVGQVLDILRQLCHGLGAAHTAGLVHRDLKPENVFLAASRHVGVPYTVKLLDFGIAKVVQETHRNVTEAVGTPMWMAPEQTEPGHAITPAADVWSLGLIAFRLLTGRDYWRAANATTVSAIAILREVVYEPLETASARAAALGSTVTPSAAFDTWFARCVNRDPGQRFPDAMGALNALESALAPEVLHRPDDSEAWSRIETIPRTRRGEPPVFAVNEAPPATEPAPLPATQVFGDAGAAAPILDARHEHSAEGSSRSRRENGTVRGVESIGPTEDVDSYEKRLSRGRWWASTGVAVLIGGAGFGFWQYRSTFEEPAPFAGAEVEPNNRAPHATPVPFGERVAGQIGQRLDEKRSDIDFYRFSVPEGSGLLRFEYKALPNIAPCLLWYRSGVDEPFARYCVGQPGRDLTVPGLRLAAGDYILAVTQDREQYTDAPPPPVLENVSDRYQLHLTPGEGTADAEVEPNDTTKTAMRIGRDEAVRGRLAWMRDVDVVCTDAHARRVRFVVEETETRPRGAVLEVTPLGGPADGIPVRVHPAHAQGSTSERDVVSPWRSPEVDGATGEHCVSLTLARDVWAEPPLPRVAPAGNQEYVVRLEEL